MEHDNSVRRLMLLLLTAGMIVILNMLLVVSGEANEFWSELHLLIVSLSEHA